MGKILAFMWFYIFRLWPWWAVIGLGISLGVAGKLSPNRRHKIFTISGIVMVIIGAIIQLVILNQNMSTLNDTSLLSQITQSRSVTVTIPSGNGNDIEGGYVTVRATNQTKTIKEKISILERELDHAEKEIIRSREFILTKFHENKLRADSKLNDLDDKVNQIRRLLENTVVGDYRIQLFSILITIFGSVLLVVPALKQFQKSNLGSTRQDPAELGLD